VIGLREGGPRIGYRFLAEDGRYEIFRRQSRKRIWLGVAMDRRGRWSPPAPAKDLGARVDTYGAMDGPIQRDGSWWQRANGSWYRWNAPTRQWEEQPTGPPPPASPHAVGDPAGARTVTAVAPVRTSTSDRFDETWASVTVRPETSSDWSALSPQRSFGSGPRLLGSFAGLLAVLVLAAAAAGVYFFFLRSAGPPSEEEVEAAFVPLRGGLEYQPPPEGFTELLNDAIDNNAQAGEIYGHVDVRAVSRGGPMEGFVFIGAVDPDDVKGINKQDLTQPITSGFEQFSGPLGPAGVTMSRVTRAGVPMYEAAFQGAAVAVFVDEDDGFVFSVAARDVQLVHNMSRQLAKAHISDA
jgi:hypothetical protein